MQCGSLSKVSIKILRKWGNNSEILCHTVTLKEKNKQTKKITLATLKLKMKASPDSPSGSGIKATLPACCTQSNLPWKSSD